VKKLNRNSQFVDSLLEAAGIRIKAARTHILSSLIRFGRPVSHSELTSEEAVEKYDRVTVYRTLKTLQKGGLVHAVRGTDGITRYCAHSPAAGGCPGDHPHFICRCCGKMVCLSDQRMSRVEVPEGYTVEGKQFLVFGMCDECTEPGKL